MQVGTGSWSSKYREGFAFQRPRTRVNWRYFWLTLLLVQISNILGWLPHIIKAIGDPAIVYKALEGFLVFAGGYAALVLATTIIIRRVK